MWRSDHPDDSDATSQPGNDSSYRRQPKYAHASAHSHGSEHSLTTRPTPRIPNPSTPSTRWCPPAPPAPTRALTPRPTPPQEHPPGRHTANSPASPRSPSLSAGRTQPHAPVPASHPDDDQPTTSRCALKLLNVRRVKKPARETRDAAVGTKVGLCLFAVKYAALPTKSPQ